MQQDGSKRRRSARLLGQRRRSSEHEALGALPLPVWQRIISCLGADPKSLLALGSSSSALQQAVAAARPFNLAVNVNKGNVRRFLGLPMDKLLQRLPVASLQLSIQRGTDVPGGLGYFLSRSCRTVAIKADAMALDMCVALLYAKQHVPYVFSLGTCGSRCPLEIDELSLTLDGDGTLAGVTALLAGCPPPTYAPRGPPFTLRRLDIGIKGNDEWLSIAKITSLEGLTIRYQTYQNPSCQDLGSLPNLKSFRFVQEDSRARIQLDAFAFLKKIGRALRKAKGECFEDVHLEVILARQESSLAFFKSFCMLDLALVVTVPDDAAAAMGHLFTELQSVVEDSVGHDEWTEEQLSFRLEVKSNSFRNRSKTVACRWPVVDGGLPSCSSRHVAIEADGRWLPEGEYGCAQALALELTGNTGPLHGLPLGLEQSAMRNLTIHNCVVDVQDLQALALMDNLHELDLSADFSAVPAASEGAPSVLWTSLCSMPCLCSLRVNHEGYHRTASSSSSATGGQATPQRSCAVLGSPGTAAYGPLLEASLSRSSAVLTVQDVYLWLLQLYQPAPDTVSLLPALRVSGFSAGPEVVTFLLQLAACNELRNCGRATAAIVNAHRLHVGGGQQLAPERGVYPHSGIAGTRPVPRLWISSFCVATETGFVSYFRGPGIWRDVMPGLPRTQLCLPAPGSVALSTLLNQGGILSLPSFKNLLQDHPVFSHTEATKQPVPSGPAAAAEVKGPRPAEAGRRRTRSMAAVLHAAPLMVTPDQGAAAGVTAAGGKGPAPVMLALPPPMQLQQQKGKAVRRSLEKDDLADLITTAAAAAQQQQGRRVTRQGLGRTGTAEAAATAPDFPPHEGRRSKRLVAAAVQHQGPGVGAAAAAERPHGMVTRRQSSVL